MEVNVHEAKTQLSRLIKRVEAGEEIVIARAGVPVARLVAAGTSPAVRPMGMDRGKIWISDDFDAPDAELEALFYREIPGFPSSKRDPKPSTAAGKKKSRKPA